MFNCEKFQRKCLQKFVINWKATVRSKMCVCVCIYMYIYIYSTAALTYIYMRACVCVGVC